MLDKTKRDDPLGIFIAGASVNARPQCELSSLAIHLRSDFQIMTKDFGGWQLAVGGNHILKPAVARNIDGIYKPVRRHSSLNFQSPIPFEQKVKEVSQSLSTKAGQAQ